MRFWDTQQKAKFYQLILSAKIISKIINSEEGKVVGKSVVHLMEKMKWNHIEIIPFSSARRAVIVK